jgi:hypothetical protein
MLWKGEPMSWGIAETASEIEKIKSESADYLNGLNSCGVIDWNTYNYAFDFYADLLMKAYEQGKKDTQSEITRCKDCKNIWYSGMATIKGVPTKIYKCDWWDNRVVSEKGFCYMAERKTDE